MDRDGNSSGTGNNAPTEFTPWEGEDLPLMEVQGFDMRNGSPESACRLLVRLPMAQGYHWVPVQGMPPEAAMSHIDAFIKSQHMQLMAHPPAGWTPDRIKKIAICLGISRAVATANHRIQLSDIIPEERASPVFNYRPLAAGATKGTTEIVPGLSDEERAFAALPMEYTDEEKAAMAVLMRCSLATIPLQGYSLVVCGQHYLSDKGTRSRKAFAAVERQFWGEPAIKDWLGADIEQIQDAMWLKATHPVNVTVKYGACTSQELKVQLVTAGVGLAAAWLPAMEPEVRAGTCYIALFDVLRPLFQMFGGVVKTDLLELAVATVQAYPFGTENPRELQNRDKRIPLNVVNRRTAVHWVSSLVNRNAKIAAECYGFYIAMSDRTQMSTAGGGFDTLRCQLSLKKLATNQFPAYRAGYEKYGDYAADVARARSRGGDARQAMSCSCVSKVVSAFNSCGEMANFKVFVGYDPREDIAYEVCRHSILKKASIPVEIIPIKQSELRKNGLYWREKDQYESTEFSFSRFLTPKLANYEGWAMFVDCDFLYLADIKELRDLIDEKYAVMCVQHEYVPKEATKMDGAVQTVYPRKNWSSMVLYNCGHPKNSVLTPEAVNTETGAFLHRFQWLQDDEIGSIPFVWNFLEGHNKVVENDPSTFPKAIHYTRGGPWFEAWKNCAFADLWLKERDEYQNDAKKAITN
ncbi:hypothetical protein V8G54_022794 [Vigna mungo]|uniref:Uncharacterized protein n=1 Tax=Vigna mungo TaxID=3915 RepID=A0AAQ3N2J3_VIGMU